MTDDDKALVTQADMDAAFDTGIRLAKSDWLKLYEAFARHRKQAIEAQAAEIERLREALTQIAAPAYVSVGTHKHMHLAWREIACRRIDIARAALGETE